jgi:nucleotide-binding universal stress UspA family protein
VFNEVIVCLDGSSVAEKIIPLAHGLTQATGGKLVFLRVVQEAAEMSAEEEYLTDCARQYGAQLRFAVSPDPAEAIRTELVREPRATAALTTHGRAAWAEAIMGSVAFRVLRESKRPVLLFRPRDKSVEVSKKITIVAVTLDGNEFSEKILPYAIRAVRSLSARLLLLQALPVRGLQPLSSHEDSGDVVESSYLHRKAAEIKATHGIDAQWEVLHGDPGDAISEYLNGMPETLLAMTTHARTGAERVMLGSIAVSCIRGAGVPLLLYWPPHKG